MAPPLILYLQTLSLQRKPSGRAHIDQDSLRRNRASRAFARVRPFFESCTDARGISSIQISLSHMASPLYPRWTSMITDEPFLEAFVRHAVYDETPSGEHAELVRASRAAFPVGPRFEPSMSIGAAIAALRWTGQSREHGQRSWRDPVPPAPSFAAIQEMLERWEDVNIPYSVAINCRFLLVDAHGAPLPYTDEHFQVFGWNDVQLHLQNGWNASAVFTLKLPWCAPDPGLSAIVGRLRETLPVFDAKRGFYVGSAGRGRPVPLPWTP